MQSVRRPLRSCSDEDALHLWECIWAIQPCTKGDGSHQACENRNCTRQLEARLGRYLRFYKGLTETYLVDPAQVKPALLMHADVFALVSVLKQMPDSPRHKVVRACFGAQARNSSPSAVGDQERALDIAVRAMTMMNSRTHDISPGILESGGHQRGWMHDHTLAQFIEISFPGTNSKAWNQMQVVSQDTTLGLTAKRLVKRAKLSFEPTDDLRKHLELDRKSGKIAIFHHVAFLKEHLKMTKGQPEDTTISDQLRQGAIPRSLALETLVSIQEVLFPHDDTKSRDILRSLIAHKDFDPECLLFEFNTLRDEREQHIEYRHWGERLIGLRDELESPTPRGVLEEWLHRRSGARHVMLATLVGVLFAVFLGILSLVVSVFQAYVGYRAWKTSAGN